MDEIVDETQISLKSFCGIVITFPLSFVDMLDTKLLDFNSINNKLKHEVLQFTKEFAEKHNYKKHSINTYNNQCVNFNVQVDKISYNCFQKYNNQETSTLLFLRDLLIATDLLFFGQLKKIASVLLSCLFFSYEDSPTEYKLARKIISKEQNIFKNLKTRKTQDSVQLEALSSYNQPQLSQAFSYQNMNNSYSNASEQIAQQMDNEEEEDEHIIEDDSYYSGDEY